MSAVRSNSSVSLSALLLFVTVAGCATRPTCELRGEPRVLLEEGPPGARGSKRLVLWEIDDAPVLWSTTMPASPTLRSFQAEVRARTGDVVDPRRLLERAYDDPALIRERPLNALVLGRVASDVAPMRCFDALFLARQAERLDMVATPSEVLVAVFRSPDGRRLRLVELTVNEAGIGRLSPIRPSIDEAIAQGWRFLSVFHNHNFFFEAGAWHGGAVAPSLPDALVSANMAADDGLEQIWITNGFSTLVLPTSALGDVIKDERSAP